MPPAADHVHRLRAGIGALRASLGEIRHFVATARDQDPFPKLRLRIDVLKQIEITLASLTATVNELEDAHAQERLVRDRGWTQLVVQRDVELQEAKALLHEANLQLNAESERCEIEARNYAQEHQRRVQAEERADAAEMTGLRDWDADAELTSRVFLLEGQVDELVKRCATAEGQTKAAEDRVEKMQLCLFYEQAETHRAQQEVIMLKDQMEELKSQIEDLKRARIRAAWTTYDALWSVLTDDALPFSAVPWPTVETPRDLEGITPHAIRELLFSDTHSSGQSKRERVKKALLRWHPDKFRSKLQRVPESEREDVQHAVNLIAVYLNDLLKEV